MTFYKSFYSLNDRLILVDYKDQDHDFCEKLEVAEVKHDIIKHSSTLVVKISHADGSFTQVDLPRDEAVMNPLTSLVKHGLSVANVHEYVVTVSEILMTLEKFAPVKYQHSTLGFNKIKDTKVFLAGETDILCGVSRYYEYDKLKPLGTFSEWRKFVIPLVEDTPSTLLALAMGASAPVAYLLESVGTLDSCPIFALIGASSRSKSTILKLSASVWGKASTSGIIDTLLDTENYFIATLSSKNGFPHYIDESTVCSWDFTKLLYNISMGCERGRCKSDGTLKPVRRWKTVVTFTGEKSLFSQSSNSSGLYSRLIQFDQLWSKDAATAEQISQFVIQQYGTAGPVFIETLQTISLPDLNVRYKYHVDALKEYVRPENGVEERILKKLALLRITIEIMEQAWNIPVDFSTIDDLLIETFNQNAPHADRHDVIYESLKQYIISHENLFPDESTLQVPQLAKIAKYGVIGKYKHQPCVWIISEFFDKFLEKHGLEPTPSTLHIFNKRGMIAYFGDRFRIKHAFGKGMKTLCYCVFLGGATTTSNFTLEKKNKKISQIDQLLADEESEE